jgi:hypothetical protein
MIFEVLLSTNGPLSLEWFQSPFVITLFSIVVSFLLWLITPQYLRQKLKKIFMPNSKIINTNELRSKIRELKLGIYNEGQLSVDEFVRSYKYVFFPVVPNKSPNIIHITFINAIKGLEKLGLYVLVFIYDDYFGKIRGYDFKERETYITNFSKRLQDMGIKRRQIIYESKVLKNKAKTHKMMMVFLDLASKLTVDKIDALSVVNRHYVNADTLYIRKFKSFLNIIYPKCISSKIGFVLSGEDEKKLWETYVKNVEKHIVHLYIDSLYNNEGMLGNILDEENLSFEDTIDTLKVKISNTLSEQNLYIDKSSIFYLFDYNFFILKKHIEFDNSDGNTLMISSVEKLIKYCKEQFDNGGIKPKTLDILSKTAYNIFHSNEGV